MSKKILYLTITREWFDKIFIEKTKKKEYRDIKPYWEKRLFDTDGHYIKFNEIHFRNGYNKNSPFGIIEHKGTYTTHVYELLLGKILQLKNVPQIKESSLNKLKKQG